MSILHAIILGFIEGITEFLPISSTFHLLIGKQFLGLFNNFFVDNFIVIIQSGAIFAAVFLYLKRILLNFSLLKNLLLSLLPTL